MLLRIHEGFPAPSMERGNRTYRLVRIGSTLAYAAGVPMGARGVLPAPTLLVAGRCPDSRPCKGASGGLPTLTWSGLVAATPPWRQWGSAAASPWRWAVAGWREEGPSGRRGRLAQGGCRGLGEGWRPVARRRECRGGSRWRWDERDPHVEV
jgi:hypothetical protein